MLHEHIGVRCLVYIDDVIIWSKDPKSHTEDVSKVLKTLSEAQITLKRSKCTFFKDSIDLLGFVVSKDGISPQPSKVGAIRNMRPPSTPTEIKRFLGMAGYYSQCIPQYARYSEPLNRLTRKNAPWEWGDEQEVAFESLKQALTSTSVMAYPQPDKPYYLYTDASLASLGGCFHKRIVSESNAPSNTSLSNSVPSRNVTLPLKGKH